MKKYIITEDQLKELVEAKIRLKIAENELYPRWVNYKEAAQSQGIDWPLRVDLSEFSLIETN